MVAMLKVFKLRRNLRSTLLSSGVTGEIAHHGAKMNLEALKRVQKSDPYVTFGITVVEDAAKRHAFTLPKLIDIMAASLGITAERFKQAGPGFIDPQLTGERLGQMMEVIEATIASDGLIVLATSHPGSLLAYYMRLAELITSRGGQLAGTPAPVLIAEYRWIDVVAGVHVLTDEGNLLHTHDSAGFDLFLHALPTAPSLVIADHGYAGAAINRGIKTIALHDVDDPGIPVAAYLGCDVLAIPMNDNQLNQPTATVVDAAFSVPTPK